MKIENMKPISILIYASEQKLDMILEYADRLNHHEMDFESRHNEILTVGAYAT